MTERNLNNTDKKEERLEVEESKLRFEDKVVAKISKLAVSSLDGILDMKGNFFDSVTNVFAAEDQRTSGIDVEVGAKEARVNLQVILEYGKSAPQIFEQIKTVVRRSVKEMTGLDVVTVNVDVVDVMTKKEYQDKNTDNSENR